MKSVTAVPVTCQQLVFTVRASKKCKQSDCVYRPCVCGFVYVHDGGKSSCVSFTCL